MMTSAPEKIAILLPDLRAGGVERMRMHLAQAWLRRGIGVEFVLMRAQGELMPRLPDGAGVVDLAVPRVRGILPPLIRYLRRARPDVLLAAMWPLTVAAPLAARLAGIDGRVIVSEHNHLSRAYGGRGWLHRCLLRASMRLAYPMAHTRIGVSRGVVDDLARLSGLGLQAFSVVYNPAAIPPARNGFERPEPLRHVSGPVLLAVGSLKRQKRHDLLIEAFAKLPDRLGATLFILGEGSARADLERLIASFGLAGRVVLPGFVHDTAPWYAHADLFVLSSDYEGFGNVIVEALQQGVPVVSTDCLSGPAEILDQGRFGTLVPTGDAEAIAQAMRKALSEPVDPDALRARAREFAADTVADRYLELMRI